MSFRDPLVLIALVAVPVVIALHRRRRRGDAAAMAAFSSAPLLASVAPRRPGWRVHVPVAALAAALILLIVAAARPQRVVSVALLDGAVMLADDTSSSMGATDVHPTRLAAAAQAARQFIATVPKSIRVGVETFAGTPALLQSPTTDHATAAASLTGLRAYGHTAIGDALNTALTALEKQKTASGRRVPGAIVLLSDGTSTTGTSPLAVAHQAAAQHIPVDTVAVGTPDGRLGTGAHSGPVPVDASELRQIAQISGGRTFTAADAGHLSTVYTGLAHQLSRHREHHDVTASLAGAGMILLLGGGALSLAWFGRPIP
jgi:Ca-activated chloride channel homolog